MRRIDKEVAHDGGLKWDKGSIMKDSMSVQ